MKGIDSLIATMIIVIISITAVFLTLELGKPSTERTQDILLMQEGKNTLLSIDNAVRSVLEEGEGSTRLLKFSLSGGNYLIDNQTDAVTFSMESTSQIIASGVSKIENGINMSGGYGMIFLNLSYENFIDVTGEGEFGRGYHTVTVRNDGYNSTTQKQMIYISTVPPTPPTPPTFITFTGQYNQTQTFVLKGTSSSSPNNLNDLGINTYDVIENLESGGQSNYFQAETLNITGSNTTSADYTNNLDGKNYNVTSTIGQSGGIAVNRYNQTSSANITGNASTTNQATINNLLNTNKDSQTWDITENQTGFQLGSIIVTYYNFSDYTNNKARKASPAGSNRWLAGTEATTTEYTNMQTDNGVFAVACADASNDEPFWRFNFTINEAESSIQWINVTFNGRENATESGTCYVYNFSGSAWVSMGAIPTTDSTRSQNYTSNPGYLIDNSNKQFVIVCEGANFDGTATACTDAVLADYVLVKVGYISQVPVYSASVEHNTTVSYSGTLNNINISINFTSTVDDIYNMSIYNFASSSWDAGPCQNQSAIANTYYTIWCNVTTNPTNYNSSIGIVRVRLNSTVDGDRGTLKEEYVQYHIDYTTNPTYANISIEHNSSIISENPSTITKINVTTILKTNITSGIPFKLYIYNFNTPSWEQCYQASVNNTTYAKMECNITTNPSYYISDSKIRIRLNSSGDTITHQMMEDYLVYQIITSSIYRAEVEHNATGVTWSGALNNITISLNFSTNVTSTFNLTIYNFNSWIWEDCDGFDPTINTWYMRWCNITTNPSYYNSSTGVIRVRLNNTPHTNLARIREDYIQYYVTYTT